MHLQWNDQQVNGDARPALLLAGLLISAGIAHFLLPAAYDSIVPPALPGPARAYTYVSGIAEIVCGAAVAYPGTRRQGATEAAALFVAVFPANLYMAYEWSDRTTPERLIAYARLPLQIPLVWWAWRVRAGAAAAAGHHHR